MSTTTSDQGICARIAQRLAKQVGPRRFSLWFDRSARFDYRDDQRQLQVAVPSRFIAEWIGQHFHEELRRAVTDEVGQEVTLDLRVDPTLFIDVAASAVPPVAPEPSASKGHVDVLRPVFRHELAGFIVGPSNELAYTAACRMAEDDSGSCHPLFIHGGCGLGKTHLLQGICARLMQHRPDARVQYLTGEQFTNEFLTSVRTNRIDDFRRRVRRLDLLAVDDVHFIANKQATQQEFLHSFDAIELGGARVVLASDSHPKLIKQFSEALVSRCVRGMVVEIRPPDLATRSRLIRALAARRGLTLLDQSVQMLAGRCCGSVREIEGMLTSILALARLGQSARSDEPIGPAVIERLFGIEFVHTPRRAVRFDALLTAVSEHLGVSRAQIVGNSRHRQVVLARSLVIRLARQLTSMSYPEIAAAMGRRNHSTIVTACQRIEKQFERNQFVVLPGSLEEVSLSELEQRLRYAAARL